ncbi:unnamed protein product [Phaedon cochleariae]|uniref:DUF4806 domain-containing protein n=1 Tax=Phaedon cochleariae TaxID=80249 RepID=A0A9P0DPA5_PHACE|nr:unnamed protein product [Phaedon cochleariae]
MEEKSWTVVLFLDDKTVEAIPSNWIQGQLCYWPSLATEKLLQAIRKCEPVNTCWPSHNIKIFRNATFDDYARARAKAKIAEETSDLNSDSEQVKRKRVQKILSSSESDSSYSILPSPPKIKKKNCKDDAMMKKSVLNRNNDEDEIQIDPFIGIENRIEKQNDALIEVWPNVNEKENFNPVCKACIERDKSFKTIFEQIHIIRGISIDILSEVKDLKKNTNRSNILENKCTFYTMHSNIKFPLKTVDEIDVLEGILNGEDDFQLLVLEFAKIGGTNCYNFVKRVLSTSLTNEMALQYSWLGRKGKLNFSKLNIAKVIINAAEKADISQNRTDTEVAIQTWLKRASDRRNSAINKKN